jgi:hypothetical protein
MPHQSLGNPLTGSFQRFLCLFNIVGGDGQFHKVTLQTDHVRIDFATGEALTPRNERRRTGFMRWDVARW